MKHRSVSSHHRHRIMSPTTVLLLLPALALSLSPFDPTKSPQPVTGAITFSNAKLCDALQYGAKGDNQTDDTVALQQAINACGDLSTGGTVLLAKGKWFVSGALWLRSNLTFVVEGGLIGSTDPKAYPLTYTRYAKRGLQGDSWCWMLQSSCRYAVRARCAPERWTLSQDEGSSGWMERLCVMVDARECGYHRTLTLHCHRALIASDCSLRSCWSGPTVLMYSVIRPLSSLSKLCSGVKYSSNRLYYDTP